MQRWEYKVISRKQVQQIEPALNTLGDEGWELVALNFFDEGWIFKRPKEAEPFERLSEQEKELLKLVVEGRTNGAIAKTMRISVKKVQEYRSNLMSRLELQSNDMAGLVKIAFKHSLLNVMSNDIVHIKVQRHRTH